MHGCDRVCHRACVYTYYMYLCVCIRAITESLGEVADRDSELCESGGFPKAAISQMHTRTHQRLHVKHVLYTCLCHQMGEAGCVLCIKACSYSFCACLHQKVPSDLF